MFQITSEQMEEFKALFSDACIFCERSRIPGLPASDADRRLNNALREAREILLDTRELLSNSDPKTLDRMEQYLERSDPEAVRQIIDLIDKELLELDKMSVENFQGDPGLDVVARAEYSWIGKERGPLMIKVGRNFRGQPEILDGQTIIHELSHFRRVADTSDAFTGPVWAQRPTVPINNAEQLELFFGKVAGDLVVARSRATRNMEK